MSSPQKTYYPVPPVYVLLYSNKGETKMADVKQISLGSLASYTSPQLPHILCFKVHSTLSMLTQLGFSMSPVKSSENLKLKLARQDQLLKIKVLQN